ncbi:MAG: glycosyltransferase [Steroidobacteraceae bacterium]
MSAEALSADPAAMPGTEHARRITIVSGLRIFPCQTGGHLRTGGIALALARLGHEVTLYSLAGRQSDYRLAALFRGGVSRQRIAPNLVEETNLGLGFGLSQTLARRAGYPRFWQYELMRRGLVPSALKAKLQNSDIVISDLPWCPPVPGPWARKPWFLISHNLEHRLLEQEQTSARDRRFAAKMRQVEVNAPRLFRDIFVCAEEDRDFFRHHDPTGRLKLPLIPCGVDPSAYRVAPGTRERVRAELSLSDADRVVVFAASRFGPNVEAFALLEEFCRAQQDLLAREHIRILVLGSIVESPRREGALIATGRVPEVAPYFAAADAGLNPVTRGSGANVKIFEYLAARLPVISTVFGVRGTPLRAEQDFLTFDPLQPAQALQRFAQGRTSAQWRSFADSVWQRHHASCDINELVQLAIALRPEFGLTE